MSGRNTDHAGFGRSALVLLALVGTLFGCSQDRSGLPSAAGKATPYILKEDCRFTIVTDRGSAGVSSPKVSGAGSGTASASVSIGAMSITVSDCAVTGNPHSLPMYQG